MRVDHDTPDNADEGIVYSDGTWFDLDPDTWTELHTAVPPVRVMPMRVDNPGTKVLVRDKEGGDGGIEPNGPVTIVDLPKMEDET